MRKLIGIGFALALLAVTTPALSGPPGPYPYCWNVNYTQCPSPGQTIHCTDGIWHDYLCTCISWNGQYIWDCDDVR